MPSANNNNSSKLGMSSLSFGKGKHSLAASGLVLLILLLGVGYYYMYKSNRNEPFESAPNLSPASGECIVALFYADWCGHCKKFKPDFEKAMSKLNGKVSKGSETKGSKVNFVKVDCDVHKSLATDNGVSGYPTVKIFKSDGSSIDYDGERSYNGLKKYLVIDD